MADSDGNGLAEPAGGDGVDEARDKEEDGYDPEDPFRLDEWLPTMGGARSTRI